SIHIDGKFKLGNRIRGESNSEVYAAKHIFSSAKVAAKLQPFDLGSPSQAQRPLQHEFLVLKAVAGGIGIPYVHWFGTDVSFQVMILDCLGSSLKELLQSGMCILFFSDCQMTMGIYARQVSPGEFIHSCNYIHRDIKPSNLLVGQEKMQNTVYLINFGVAWAY
ncbi:hypothetical protein SCLCIDRAFT_145125, partial [Scleroderma citrinum Foug A]